MNGASHNNPNIWCSTQDTSNGAVTTVKSDLSLGHSTKCEYGSYMRAMSIAMQ
jgi:hypothetical protein